MNTPSRVGHSSSYHGRCKCTINGAYRNKIDIIIFILNKDLTGSTQKIIEKTEMSNIYFFKLKLRLIVYDTVGRYLL